MAPTNELAPAQNIVVQLEGPKRRMGLKGRIACWATVAIALVGAYNYVDDKFDFLPDLPSLPGLPHLDLGTEPQPPQAESGVRHEFYTTEAEFSLECTGQVSVAAEVKGKEEDRAIPGLGHIWANGSGEVSKVIFGDVLLCGDSGSLAANAELEHDPTGKIIKVTAHTDGLVPTHPRVDHTAAENCATTHYGDSKAAIDKAIAKWEKQQRDWEQHKKGAKDPGCDDGFKVTGVFARERVAEIKDTANAAAQIAMAMDAQPRQQIEAENTRLLSDLQTMLSQRYPGAEVKVQLNGIGDQRQHQMDVAVAELQANHYVVTPPAPGGNEMKVSAPGGGEITVRTSSNIAQGVTGNRLRQLDERPLPAIQSATTTTLQRRAA